MATVAAILNIETDQFFISMSPLYLPPSFGLSRLTVWEQMSLKDFQDDRHVSAHSNLQFSRRCRLKNFKMAERNDFSNSKSPCLPDATNKFQLIRLTVREHMSLKDFQDGRHIGRL